MPPAFSRWPTAATPATFSGSSRAAGRSSRSTTFHLSRSLAKRVRSGRFTVTRDRASTRCLLACADREETWINSMIERATLGLHAVGHAHSIECWHDGELVGGLYGVKLGRAFFGESMFSRMTDASKVALAWLVARLQGRPFHLARLPVHDRPPRLAGRDDGQPRSLCRIVGCGAVVGREPAAADGARCGAGAGSAAGASASPRPHCRRPISRRSTGCSKRPAPPARRARPARSSRSSWARRRRPGARPR